MLSTPWRLFVGTFKLWFIITSLMSISIGIYVTFYNFYIPRFAHIYPVFFVHDVVCLQRSLDLSTAANCHYPRYEILDRDRFFERRQEYSIRLHLKMSDSSLNHDVGMFMVHLRLLNFKNQELLHSCRPGLFPYSSNYIRRLQLCLLSLFYLFHYYEETRVLTVSILDEHTLNTESIPFEQVYRIKLELETLKKIEVVSAKLEVTARLNTFQHLMYHWPLSTSVIAIFVIFVGLVFFTFLVFIFNLICRKVD